MPSQVKDKALSCMLLLLFLQASLMSVVSLQGGMGPAGHGKRQCQITLDVCGKAAPSAASQVLEPASNPVVERGYYFPSISFFPPIPVPAVASAEPGDTEKPPEA